MKLRDNKGLISTFLTNYKLLLLLFLVILVFIVGFLISFDDIYEYLNKNLFDSRNLCFGEKEYSDQGYKSISPLIKNVEVNNPFCVNKIVGYSIASEINPIMEDTLLIGRISDTQKKFHILVFILVGVSLTTLLFFKNEFLILKEIFTENFTPSLSVLSILIFFNFLFINYLNLIFSKIEFLRFSGYSFLKILFFNILLLFILIFFIFISLKIEVLKYFVVYFLVIYPVSKLFFSNTFFVYLINLLFVILFFRIKNKKIFNLLFVFNIIFLLTHLFQLSFFIQDNYQTFKTLNSNDIQSNTEFSNEYPPIIILWYDEFPNSLLINKDSELREEYTNLNRLYKNSIYFPYNYSLSHRSLESINETFLRGDLIENLLKNYNIKTFEKVSNICSPNSCNISESMNEGIYFLDLIAVLLSEYSYYFFDDYLPGVGGKYGHFWKEYSGLDYPYDFPDELNKIENQLFELKNNELLFIHSIFPHLPWKYFDDGSEYYIFPQNKRAISFYNDEYENWNEMYKNSQFLQNIEKSRFISQAVYLDKTIGNIIDILQTEGLFDDSLIIVASDHGISFDPNYSSRSPYKEDSDSLNDNFAEILNTPLLIKLPNQTTNLIYEEVTSNIIIEEIIDFGLKSNFNFKSGSETRDLINYLNIENENINNLRIRNLNKERFTLKIREAITSNEKAFLFRKNNYGWVGLNDNIENLETFVPFSIEDYKEENIFYFVSTIDKNIKNVIVKYNEKSLKVKAISDNKNNYIVFLFEKPITYDELKNVKFYIDN